MPLNTYIQTSATIQTQRMELLLNLKSQLLLCWATFQHDSVTLRSDDERSLEDDHQCVEVMRSFLAGRINDPVSHGEIF